MLQNEERESTLAAVLLIKVVSLLFQLQTTIFIKLQEEKDEIKGNLHRYMDRSSHSPMKDNLFLFFGEDSLDCQVFCVVGGLFFVVVFFVCFFTVNSKEHNQTPHSLISFPVIL